VRKDVYDFAADYDLEALPIWFTPGLFTHRDGNLLSERALDAGYFNVVHEFYPTTSRQYKFDRKGNLKGTKRPSRVPTYGKWQGILPDQRLHTVALAQDPKLLERFALGQTYLLGKKRTMMQVMKLSGLVAGKRRHGVVQTGPLQLSPDRITSFQSFDVIAATLRYLIVHGETREETDYTAFDLEYAHMPVALPDFYLADTPVIE
jgi:hypothetical protein